MKAYRLILLDVDGTLVHCAGAGRRSLERVLREACGCPEGDLTALRLDGSTDRLIVRHAMELLGHPFSDHVCDLALARYVEILPAELEDQAFRVLPGVVEALEALRGGAVPFGLCTGNVMEGARLKLRRGVLDGYFEWGPAAVGGFAHDGEERTRVVEAALRRAAARNGGIAPGEVLVVGDTPLDVAAAHGAGCAALGVATGRYGIEELAACGADHVVETLESPAALRLLAR
jgi:phosphoglycolate phosphatase-like HAD superfamily hydrolase